MFMNRSVVTPMKGVFCLSHLWLYITELLFYWVFCTIKCQNVISSRDLWRYIYVSKGLCLCVLNMPDPFVSCTSSYVTSATYKSLPLTMHWSVTLMISTYLRAHIRKRTCTFRSTRKISRFIHILLYFFKMYLLALFHL